MKKYIKNGELLYALYLDREAVRELVRNSWKDFKDKQQKLFIVNRDWREVVEIYKDFLIDVVEEEFIRVRLCDVLIADVEDEELLFFESAEEFVDYVLTVYKIEIIRDVKGWDE